MRNKKKIPIALLLLMDFVLIAAYVLGFYGLYYRVPRQLHTEATVLTEEKVESDLSYAEQFGEHFSDSVELSDSSYKSENVSISVTKHTEGKGSYQVTYYVADIYVADLTCLQSGFAYGTYGIGYTEKLLSMDQSLNAILAINGDFYGNGNIGVVIRNGILYRSNMNDADVCVLYSDGTMKTYSPWDFDADQAIRDGAWQAWSFGPELLDEEGNQKKEFNADWFISKLHPRSAIGYYEPGHYCLVVVDGRQPGYSNGMTLVQLSELFHQLGCKAAYNLDGGKSSSMTFLDSEVNRPYEGGREVSDCIIIKEAGE